MADKKISALSAASALTGTELIPVVQSGANKKATPAQISTYVNGLISLSAVLANNPNTGANSIILASGQAIASQDTLTFINTTSGFHVNYNGPLGETASVDIYDAAFSLLWNDNVVDNFELRAETNFTKLLHTQKIILDAPLIQIPNTYKIVSATPNKSQIEFSAGGNEINITTDGGTGAEGGLFIQPGSVNLNRASYGGMFIDVSANVIDHVTAISIDAPVINIGSAGNTVNILGSTLFEYAANQYVLDKLITLNYNGAAGSGTGVGYEIEENNIITGYLKTNAARDGFSFLAPANSFIGDLKFSATSTLTVAATASVSGANTGDETASTLGATLNSSSAATPNDTDLVATAESSVLKKITWTNVKAFLKTYFDTVYRLGSSAINLTTDVTATLPVANGGTSFSTYATGDTIYSSTTNVLSKLSGNSTTLKKFYTQTSNIPSWVLPNTIALGSNTQFTSATTGVDEVAFSILIPAGSVVSNDFLDIYFLASSNSSANTKTAKLFLGTTTQTLGATQSGATQIGTYTLTASNQSYPVTRFFSVKTLTSILGAGDSTTSARDSIVQMNVAATAVTTPTFASDVYLIVTINRANGGDTLKGEFTRLQIQKL